MKFSAEFSKGIAQAIFWSVFDRITDDKVYVTDPQLKKQGVEFFVDGVAYSLRFSSAFKPTFIIPLFTKSENKILQYEWGYTNKTHATVYITRDSLNWKLYFFTAGEIAEFIRKYERLLVEEKKTSMYSRNSPILHSIHLRADNHLSHKKPATIPIVGEPDVSDIKLMHEYIKKYFT